LTDLGSNSTSVAPVLRDCKTRSLLLGQTMTDG